ncbi:Myblike DNAbinding domain-containing protein [Puccinia graminis f. sp. tritici]|uniref:Myblike DNAbinding domain-containing protein n=1 Tax=Puccinia graminis f. sp. tritici TaxID=56615 RepID=A0A5B0R8T8_PUCGR|nr:Myblike DNAbinding domain-containing protein [Puccinia graminis f. sp. tritici]
MENDQTTRTTKTTTTTTKETTNGTTQEQTIPASSELTTEPTQLLGLFPIEQDHETFDSLNILSELATSVVQTTQQQTNQPQQQEQEQLEQQASISDNAFQALLLASLSDPFPTNPSSSSSSSNSSANQRKQQKQQPSSSSNSPSSPTSTFNLLNSLDFQQLSSSTIAATATASAPQSQLQHQQSPALEQLNLHLSPDTNQLQLNNNNIQFNHSNEHHFITQHQHAQDLLSALSALQTDPNQLNNTLTQDPLELHHPHHPHHPHQHHQQEELDFDDPTLFSPFDPEQDQIPNQPVSLTDQIDLLFGSQPLTPQASSSSTTAATSRKVYSNSFSFQQQQNQQQQQQQIANQQQHQDLLNHLDSQLDLYNHLPLDQHHEFNFLFDPDYQTNPHPLHQTQEQQHLDEYQSYYQPPDDHQDTDDLLARLDHGIMITQEEIKLNKLDGSIEDSLTLNQVYLDQIKKSLEHLNSLHQKAQKFLSISKHCVQEIQQQQQQQQQRSASSSKLSSTHPAPPDPGAKNLSLVSDQISAISLPWFKHQFGVDLPSFEDAKKRDQYNSLLHQQPWQPPERRKLDDEVAGILRLNNQNRSAIDWDRVAKNFPDRKPIECKIQWTQKQDPSLNKSKWSLPEIDRLFEIVKKFEFKNWDLISKELATGRTPSECVKQFRIVTQEKREWTETDDLLLKEGVSTYGQNWQAVANHCGRSSNQCINRWSKTLRPDIKKGKWDPVEDEALKSAVAACGMVWKDVAPRVRGRTDAQCRERWCNILDPRIVVGNWTPEEDQKILRMRDIERKTWSEISKSFNGRRTDNHCMRRHSELKRVKDPMTKRQPTQPKPVPPLTTMVMMGQLGVGGGAPSEREGSSERAIKSRPTSTLGRVLIPADSGYTRRNHHPFVPSLDPAIASFVPSSSSSSTISKKNNPARVDGSSLLSSSTTVSDTLHSSDKSPTPTPPPPPSLNNPTRDNHALAALPFTRAPNSRLRIVNKRIKYST